MENMQINSNWEFYVVNSIIPFRWWVNRGHFFIISPRTYNKCGKIGLFSCWYIYWHKEVAVWQSEGRIQFEDLKNLLLFKKWANLIIGRFHIKIQTSGFFWKIIRSSKSTPEFQHEDDPDCEQGLLAPAEVHAPSWQVSPLGPGVLHLPASRGYLTS